MLNDIKRIVIGWLSTVTIITVAWAVAYSFAQNDWTLLNVFGWPADVREAYAVVWAFVTVFWGVAGTAYTLTGMRNI